MAISGALWVAAGVQVEANQQIRRLAAAAEQIGIAPRSRFEIELDVPNRRYEIARPST